MDTYTPLVSQETLLEMAQEKVLEDVESFTDWLCAECMEPTEVRSCKFFGPVRTSDLVLIMFAYRATDKQLAEAVREVKRRFLDDNSEEISREYDRLRAEEDDVERFRKAGVL